MQMTKKTDYKTAWAYRSTLVYHFISSTRINFSKEQKAFGGTAGRKRRRLTEERVCDEKTINSEVKYLKEAEPQEQAPAPQSVVPEAALPSSSDNDFQVHTHVAADRMPD